jgi:Family of unknown function (DUF6445)
MSLNFMVVDHFVSNPEKVRESALLSGFGTWRPNKGEVGSSIYEGMNFWGDHGAMLRALAKATGETIYPNSMFFRVTNESTEGAYVHSDREAGDYTAIVYLSHHEDDSSGTAFYRHRETQITRMPSFTELGDDPSFFEQLKREMVEGSPEHWQQTKFVPGVFNRALIFEAPLFHARVPKHGFGFSPETGRMVWVAHFSVGVN